MYLYASLCLCIHKKKTRAFLRGSFFPLFYLFSGFQAETMFPRSFLFVPFFAFFFAVLRTCENSNSPALSKNFAIVLYLSLRTRTDK